MHRYQPRFHIVYLPPKTNNSQFNAEQECLHNHYRRFIFTETSFTAVTAYQNQRVSLFYFRFGNRIIIFNLAFNDVSLPREIIMRTDSGMKIQKNFNQVLTKIERK